MNTKDFGNQKLKEQLATKMELNNKMDKFAVAVFNSHTVVRHLMKEKTGRLAKTIYYFLKADEHNACTVEVITGKAVNLGDGMDMRVPCLLTFVVKMTLLKF